MNFEKYKDSFEMFKQDFNGMKEYNTYCEMKTVINIPAFYLDSVDMKTFEESICDQMWWSINSILYNVNSEDFYENLSSFMNSCEFRNVPMWVLSRLIGGLLACKYCSFTYSENQLMAITMDAAWTSSNQDYVMKQYQSIKKIC